MKREVRVSDHALLRYIERVQGFDLDRFRKEIIAIVEPAIQCGAVTVSAGGFTYCIKEGDTVATIIPGASPLGSRIKTSIHRGRSMRMPKDAR